jgi:hypothetical protein
MLSVLTKGMHTHEDNNKLRNEASDDIEISQQGHRSIGSRNSRKHSVDVIGNAHHTSEITEARLQKRILILIEVLAKRMDFVRLDLSPLNEPKSVITPRPRDAINFTIQEDNERSGNQMRMRTMPRFSQGFEPRPKLSSPKTTMLDAEIEENTNERVKETLDANVKS